MGKHVGKSIATFSDIVSVMFTINSFSPQNGCYGANSGSAGCIFCMHASQWNSSGTYVVKL